MEYLISFDVVLQEQGKGWKWVVVWMKGRKVMVEIEGEAHRTFESWIGLSFRGILVISEFENGGFEWGRRS